MSLLTEASKGFATNGRHKVTPVSKTHSDDLDELFGSNVFSDRAMRDRLPKDTYKALKETIEKGKTLTLEVANVVANAMKDWAIEKGATWARATRPSPPTRCASSVPR